MAATTDEQTPTDPETGYADASIKRVAAENGIEYAYRDLGAGDTAAWTDLAASWIGEHSQLAVHR